MNLREFIVAKGYKDNPRRLVEDLIQLVFLILGLVAVGSVLVITIYLVISGLPAIFKIGPVEFLFGTRWASTASEPQFGILPFILTSIYGTAGAIIIGVPIGFFAAVFLAKIAPKKVREIMELCIGVLAGIPSVVYGLVGMTILVPGIRIIFGVPDGATLFAAIIVLAVMILPSVINVSLYAWISFKSELYGDAALNALYYFPMQFIGLWQWRKRGAVDDVKAVKARKMTAMQRVWLVLGCAVLTVGAALILDKVGDPQPYKDAATTVLSVIAQILMVTAFAEQWALWIVNNIISIVMWVICTAQGDSHASLMVLMWVFYLMNSVNGYRVWLKKLS